VCVVHALKGLACRAPVLFAHAEVTIIIKLFQMGPKLRYHAVFNNDIDLLRRSPWQKRLDVYCGIVILAVYFTYFLVVKSMLSAFDCTKNENGTPILDAFPAFRCDQVRV
jgi:hypothetical protein